MQNFANGSTAIAIMGVDTYKIWFGFIFNFTVFLDDTDLV